MLKESQHMTIRAGKFPDLKLPNYAQGKQAECVVLEDYQGKSAILKNIGEGKGYTKDEVDLMVSKTWEYRDKLKAAGVKLPENYRLEPYETESGWMIQMIDEFIPGGDIADKLKKETSLVVKGDLIGDILNVLTAIPNGEIDQDMAVLGDFKPENFAQKEGKTILIDYFGPKLRDDKGFVTPYFPKMDTLLTRDSITFLCGDRRGVVGRLLAVVSRKFPDVSPIANEEAISLLERRHPETLLFIKDEIKSGFAGIDSIYQVKDDKYWNDKI